MKIYETTRAVELLNEAHNKVLNIGGAPLILEL